MVLHAWIQWSSIMLFFRDFHNIIISQIMCMQTCHVIDPMYLQQLYTARSCKHLECTNVNFSKRKHYSVIFKMMLTSSEYMWTVLFRAMCIKHDFGKCKVMWCVLSTFRPMCKCGVLTIIYWPLKLAEWAPSTKITDHMPAERRVNSPV